MSRPAGILGTGSGMTAAVYCCGKKVGIFGKLANEINAELDIPKDMVTARTPIPRMEIIGGTDDGSV